MTRILIIGGVLLATLIGASAAQAGTGCNGVVSPAEWGCAPWDNNNGPQFPHYRHAAAAAPVRGATVPAPPLLKPSVAGPMAPARLITDNGGALITDNGGGLRPR